MVIGLTLTVQIRRPRYLRSLCLTSKKIFDVALPFLYRNLWLTVGGPNDDKVISLLNPRNPGLPYVRNVDIELEDITVGWSTDGFAEEDSHKMPVREYGAPQQANLMTKLLLEMLPPDILHYLRFGASPIPRDIWALLRKRQKFLELEDIRELDLPWMPLFEQDPNLPHSSARVKILHLRPYSFDSLQACQKLLQAHPEIETLVLLNRFKDGDDSNLMDSSTQAG